MNKQFSALNKIFDSKQSFVITTHVNPDGDAIGSEVALALMLKNKGKKVTIVNQSETPDHLLFLTKLFPVRAYSSKYNNLILECDCFCVVDTNSPKRFSAMADVVAKSEALKICIDHHLEQEAFADLYVIDTDVPATCELLYKIFQSRTSHVITKPIAEALYTGIMTDTASFRFPKTDSETHRIVADLFMYGIDQYKLYQQVYESGPINKLWLLGKALESIQIHHNGKVAAMILPRQIFKETKTTEADVDNFTSYVLSIKNVVVGLVFVELQDGVKVSFRSKGNISVNNLAKQFSGGGHKNASGARLKNISFDDAIKKVLSATASYV
ncbi:MAG: bifunctional oligoribonuclease/PAP phosphatase NrnA [Bacteroidota bacterium]|nr:bifunctional oligoribonuclease/PAP phosphatase NrnA [Bacteroidota bacterium]